MLKVKIAFLWTRPSRYLLAVLDELAQAAEVQLLCLQPDALAPFLPGEVTSEQVDVRMYTEFPSADTIRAALTTQLDAIVVCSWNIPSYRRVARVLSGQTTRVLFMDNPWMATAKQRLGVAAAKTYIQPLYDLVLLPGERQAQFARRLGFSTDCIIWGGYSCDVAAFGAVPLGAYKERKRFLFVGRLSPEKGISVLGDAWSLYRASVATPWDLVVVGGGPDRSLARQPGVTTLGFVQPAELPAVMHGAGALLLPSTFEPWGVVLHEAACAGLPLVASYACGAVPHLVEDGLNGFIVEPGSAESLARGMTHISDQSEAEWDSMSRASRAISERFSPRRTADNLLRAVTEHARSRLRLLGTCRPRSE